MKHVIAILKVVFKTETYQPTKILMSNKICQVVLECPPKNNNNNNNNNNNHKKQQKNNTTTKQTKTKQQQLTKQQPRKETANP